MIDEYIRKATILRIVDGDTVRLQVNLGFNTYQESNFRLYNYNAPEMRGEEKKFGELATQHLQGILPIGTEVVIRTHKADKFGRYLAEIFYETPTFAEVDLIRFLVNSGYGVPWKGRSPRPIPWMTHGYPLPEGVRLLI